MPLSPSPVSEFLATGYTSAFFTLNTLNGTVAHVLTGKRRMENLEIKCYLWVFFQVWNYEFFHLDVLISQAAFVTHV